MNEETELTEQIMTAERQYALSFREPWLYFILNLPPGVRKNIENRKTAWRKRGWIWTHASSMTDGDYLDGIRFAKKAGVPKDLLPEKEQLAPLVGGIRGRIYLEGDLIMPSSLFHHPQKTNKWWMKDQFGYVVTDSKTVPLVPCKGKMGLWPVPAEVLSLLQEATDG